MEVLDALKRIAPILPKAIGLRFQSVFHHIDQAALIFDLDREMASFRAITAEEEAATALIMAVQAKRYPQAGKLNARSHPQKAAVVACVMAIARTLQPILQTYRATFRFDRPRIDVNIPLSNFGVKGGEDFGIQFVEPLGMLHTRDGVSGDEVFHDALDSLAEGNGFEDVRKFIATRANDRNTLLYASDEGLPHSQATRETLKNRETRALILLSLTIMVLQAKGHQAMVKQAIPAFLRVIGKAEVAG